jgi:tetratricopeptide (TPR) repeat protein
LTYRSPDEKIAAKFLTDALALSRVDRFDDALTKVAEAKAMVPNYFENYRVSAFIKAQKDDILGAEEDYLLGIELEENDPKLLFYYSQFLLFKLEDADEALNKAERLKKIMPDHPFVSFLFARIFNIKQEYNKAIHIIKEMIAKGNLDAKNIRVAYTELISLYTHMAQSFVRIENDYANAVGHYKKAITTFEECSEQKILDSKMVKNFAEALISFIQFIPSTALQDHKDFLKSVILKHDSKLSFSMVKEKVIRRFAEKLDDDSLIYLLEDSEGSQKKLGSIRRKAGDVDKHYVFIEFDKESIYASRNEFLNINNKEQWRRLKNGQLVSFEIGENKVGRCAKKVSLVF